MKDEIRPVMVTIQCLAYNQKPYIRQCLEGFAMQKANFRFEAIVHDDASTDGTADIIREYAEKYPDIIKAIIETENQYTKNDGSLQRIMNENSRGKYIALCEGDDYWIDPLKLQKQFDYLEEYPEINICCHSSKRIKDNTFVKDLSAQSHNCIIPIEDVIRKGGGMVATASIMYRRKTKLCMYKKFPIDYSLQIDGSYPNGMLYLTDIMCVYRLSAQGSWSLTIKGDYEKQNAFRNKIIEALVYFDNETNKLYDKMVIKTIKVLKFKNLLAANDRGKLMRWDNLGVFLSMSLKEQIKIILQFII